MAKRRLELKGSERKELSSYVLSNRKMDRFHRKLKRAGQLPQNWNNRRRISNYDELLLFKEKGTSVVEIVQKKLSESKRPVAVLDVGCGEAIFLKELKEKFGDKIEAEGITLARPLSPKKLEEIIEALPKSMGKKRRAREAKLIKSIINDSKNFRNRTRKHSIKVHTGLAETHKYGKKYDLIFSVSAFLGTDVHRATMNTLAHLRKGGEAYIEFGQQRLTKEEKEELRRNGIEVKVFQHFPYYPVPVTWQVYYFKKIKENPQFFRSFFRKRKTEQRHEITPLY